MEKRGEWKFRRAIRKVSELSAVVLASSLKCNFYHLFKNHAILGSAKGIVLSEGRDCQPSVSLGEQVHDPTPGLSFSSLNLRFSFKNIGNYSSFILQPSIGVGDGCNLFPKGCLQTGCLWEGENKEADQFTHLQFKQRYLSGELLCCKELNELSSACSGSVCAFTDQQKKKPSLSPALPPPPCVMG